LELWTKKEFKREEPEIEKRLKEFFKEYHSYANIEE